MLLEHDLPVIPAEVAAVWTHREQIEHEASAVFGAIARAIGEAAPALARRMRAAAADEARHATLCRAIVDEAQDGGVAAAVAPRVIVLGPAELPARARALYASVALGCITETYACALLLAMRRRVTFAPVVEAVDAILPDEIDHGRIGWAHLAWAHARGEAGWLAPHVAAMRAAAIDHEVRAVPTARGLGAYGILDAAEVDAIADETWTTVIAPGLARFGLLPD